MPVLGLGVGVGVVAYVLGQALNAITDVLGLVVGLRSGWWILAAGCARQAMIIVPIVALSTVLCYLDLRVRLEGLDLRDRGQLSDTTASRPDPVLPGQVSTDDLPPAGHTGSAARDAAKDVLSRAEFHRPGPPIIERIERWVSEAISRVLDAISGVAGGGFIASVILIAAVVLVVLMLLRFGKGVQREAPTPRRPCAPGEDGARTTGGRRQPNTRPEADGETRSGADTARWSWSSRATAFSTTSPARRPARSEPTSPERCPTGAAVLRSDRPLRRRVVRRRADGTFGERAPPIAVGRSAREGRAMSTAVR